MAKVMVKKELKAWVEKHRNAAADIAFLMAEWTIASRQALIDPRYIRLADMYEDKAVEVFLQAGGEGGIAEIHLIYGIVAEATETIA